MVWREGQPNHPGPSALDASICLNGAASCCRMFLSPLSKQDLGVGTSESADQFDSGLHAKHSIYITAVIQPGTRVNSWQASLITMWQSPLGQHSLLSNLCYKCHPAAHVSLRGFSASWNYRFRTARLPARAFTGSALLTVKCLWCFKNHAKSLVFVSLLHQIINQASQVWKLFNLPQKCLWSLLF